MMKQMSKRLIVIAMMLCMLTSMLAVPVAAAGDNQSNKYNVMLVIDGSGSLVSGQTTDPNGLRYELIEQILILLGNKGHHVGAIVFSGPDPDETDASAVEDTVFVNTGLMNLETKAPDGSMPKDYINKQLQLRIYGRGIRDGVDRTENGTTDIGTALLVAQQELQKAQANNGLESKLILFTDGLTDITREAVRQQSLENMNAATAAMSQNGVDLFGVFLNKGGRLSSDEIRNIVCAANGVADGSAAFNAHYAELNDADSVNMAIQPLRAFLGIGGFYDNDDEMISGDIDADFIVPAIGIDELNIHMYTDNGEKIPNMEVELTDPSGQPFRGATIAKGTTFVNYGLTQPAAGKWHLHVDVPDNSTVGYRLVPTASMNVDAELDINPDKDALHPNMTAAFTAFLTQDGKRVTDPTMYAGYDCYLEFIDATEGSVKKGEVVKSVQIPMDNNGQFKTDVLLDLYGSYNVRVVFKCYMEVDSYGTIYTGEASSDSIYIELGNHTPVVETPVKVTVKRGLLQPDTTVVDLAKYAEDVEEDASALKAIVESTDLPANAYSINGMELSFDADQTTDGYMTLQIADSVNATATMQLEVTVKNATPMVIASIIGAILLIALLVILIIRYIKGATPTGTLTVRFTLNDMSEIRLAVSVPGNQHKNKDTLYNLLMDALRSDEWVIPGASCSAPDVPGGRVKARYLKKRLEEYKDGLENIEVSKAAKSNGLKRDGAVGVKQGKERMIIVYGEENASFTIRHVRFTITYRVQGDNGGPTRRTSQPYQEGSANDPNRFFGRGGNSSDYREG